MGQRLRLGALSPHDDGKNGGKGEIVEINSGCSLGDWASSIRATSTNSKTDGALVAPFLFDIPY